MSERKRLRRRQHGHRDSVGTWCARGLTSGGLVVSILCIGVCGGGLISAAESGMAGDRSVIDRLSGFDAERIARVGEWIDWPRDGQRLGQVARLIYQVNRLSRTGMEPLGDFDSGAAAERSVPLAGVVGDWVGIRGTAVSLASAKLPAELAEVLEFEQVWLIEILLDEGPGDTPPPGSPDASAEAGADDSENGGSRVYALTGSVPQGWLGVGRVPTTLAEPVTVSGVLVRPSGSSRPAAIVAAGLGWYPTGAAGDVAEDLALLARHGFDISLVDTISRLSGKPLLPADQAAFYGMLRAATAVGATAIGPARSVDAGELIRNASKSIGRRVRLGCQAVRVTRVGITDGGTRRLLGRDHYWQIDALGDLGKLTIRIDAGDEMSEPAIFENRYPVSVVVAELPGFLNEAVSASPGGGPQTDIAILNRRILVEGFFYRMWSYDTARMRQHGGAKQLGPLLMASRLLDGEAPPGDPVGVGKIGQLAAIAAAVMLASALLWFRVTGRADALAQARRRASS
ncbi:MAG: hypothetical protein EA381_03960 [Planctomycetaceae bacterium]|nr:MAG: hypothetical protein EA381_03960 [Planctomycetaceae bacterium]